ncbi:hypothetical protein O3M35_008730 [Rhynocoris fuscipes]|uniref:Uncharacterized protein n=1 Tax=Rhynocoris fuscipes TaxID=488301 RepID=A0AAW1DA13_9HEMI
MCWPHQIIYLVVLVPRLFRHANFNLIRLSGLPLYLKPLLHFHEFFFVDNVFF